MEGAIQKDQIKREERQENPSETSENGTTRVEGAIQKDQIKREERQENPTETSEPDKGEIQKARRMISAESDQTKERIQKARRMIMLQRVTIAVYNFNICE